MHKSASTAVTVAAWLGVARDHHAPDRACPTRCAAAKKTAAIAAIAAIPIRDGVSTRSRSTSAIRHPLAAPAPCRQRKTAVPATILFLAKQKYRCRTIERHDRSKLEPGAGKNRNRIAQRHPCKVRRKSALRISISPPVDPQCAGGHAKHRHADRKKREIISPHQ